MINIERFIDKVSSMEARHNQALVLPFEEARALRDEIAKLLLNKLDSLSNVTQTNKDQVVQVEMKGGKW
jgi:hypothetical protein